MLNKSLNYCDNYDDDDICDCGELMYVETTIEGADADGNRGVLVTWKTCPRCGREENNCPF